MSEGAGRLCLVGCGAIGRVHVRAVHGAEQRVTYAGCFDAEAGRAAAFAAEHAPGLRVLGSWDDVLADPDIEGVDLCLPHSRHLALTLEALAAGKHVFLEKPMALNAADCDRMIAAAGERNLQLSVMHNRRFNPAALAIKGLLEAGDLGDPLVITGQGIEGPNTIGVRGWLRQATEGGVGMAQTVHFAYMLQWLFGAVTEVSCLTSRKGIAWMEGQVTAAFLLRFASGAIGQLTSTFGQEVGRNEHRITMYGGSGQATFVASRADVLSPRRYGDAAWHVEEFSNSFGTDFTEPLASFGDAMRGRGQPAVNAAEGRAAVVLIEAAYRAASEGRTIALDGR
ncbi:MAG TPA: Gfo/Idh/MocA family oxidoreductase [Chloroflexota bacterium]|jgi:predicted dehydrogenase